MLTLSRVICELIEKYLAESSGSGRDCRIILPGLTQRMAREIQENLLSKRINSYLVVGEDLFPDEGKKWIRPVGLTSKRIGTFVAITCPGQLAHVHDSIRGSGGAIRSVSFSEEWPWIDNGNETFRFDGPVLDSLVQEWSSRKEEQAWLRKFILEGLINDTRTSSRRASILLEDILGSFNPRLYPGLADVREKLLYHAGVPRSQKNLKDVDKLVSSTRKLCQKIIERCQKEEDFREQVKNRTDEIISDGRENNSLKKSLDVFLDGLGIEAAPSMGILSFSSCWGNNKDNTSHWEKLTSELLEELFDVKERPLAEIVSYRLECSHGIISRDHKALATFWGEKVYIKGSCRLNEQEFKQYIWTVRLQHRNKPIASETVRDRESDFQLHLDTSGSFRSYSGRIPLKLALFAYDEERDFRRLTLHICGEHRPSFVVAEPGFEVVDPTPEHPDEAPDKKLEVDEAVQVFLFDSQDEYIDVTDMDGESVPTFEKEREGRSRVLELSERIDPSLGPSGQVIRACRFGQKVAILCFEAKDIEKGEFTLEDELRNELASQRESRVKELVKIFAGDRREPYLNLGNLTEQSRKRISLATLMEGRTGWRPLLTNLLEPDHSRSGSISDYVNYLGNIDVAGFGRITFPPQVLSLLTAYSDSREAVYKQVLSCMDDSCHKLEHPTYASYPVYVDNNSDEMEKLLAHYLSAFVKILNYLGEYRQHLEWPQVFILSHLDCVVHWDNGPLKNAFYLVGPWHPMVLAKRFLVQAALFSRAQRLLRERGKNFRRLSVLLEGIQGFRWLPGLSGEDTSAEPAYVSATSDPGWHLAIKAQIERQAIQAGREGLRSICQELETRYGLIANIVPSGSDDLAISCLSSFVRAFPSRRTVGIRVRGSYSSGRLLNAVDQFLHEEDGPTEQGKQLPGGIRLYLDSDVGEVDEIKWSSPPLYVYRYDSDDDCFKEENPDIYMLPPMQAVTFRPGAETYSLPRGRGREVVFCEPLYWLTEGQSLVPGSIVYEFDIEKTGKETLEQAFVNTATTIGTLLNGSFSIVRSIDLPQRMDCPWAIAPGAGIDPAIFVKYVRDGADRSIQERTLWDYKVDITGKQSSFYILSTIPRGFTAAVGGVFGRQEDMASGIVTELGKIGIAIGGEALKSGRHALGVIGLVAAVRLFKGIGGNGIGPLKTSEGRIGFLLPVDSFDSILGRDNVDPKLGSKRTDLLAVQLIFPREPGGKIKICACGVESKYVSRAYSQAMASSALEQARTTVNQFRSLVEVSLGEGAMPERLGLLALVRFGLRISSPSFPPEIRTWVEKERMIFEAILNQNYEYESPVTEGVLVSTEFQLPGVPEMNKLKEGWWIRLNRDHWPGIADSLHLDKIRIELESLFGVVNAQDEISGTVASGPPAGATGDVQPEQGLAEGEPAPVTRGGPEDVAREELEEERDVRVEVETRPAGPLNPIFIGVDLNRRSVYYNPQSSVDPLDNLNMMVTGSSGTGKTQFIKYLVCRFREQDRNVLILDFKNDFASDLVFAKRARIDQVFVNFDGLPYNPLIPYPVSHPGTGQLYIQCGHHIAGVVSVLAKTYGLGAQQQAAVRNAITSAFASAGLQTSGSIPYEENMTFPDFTGVGEVLQRDSIAAYNRLEPLFSLGLFKQDYKCNSFHSLVARPIILNLSQIPSDEIKNTIAQLVVLSANAYYNSQAQSGTIRQVLIFDEAHRIFRYEFLPSFVRQCRAYGVSTILSSQYPSDFPPEISASMATKILHDNGRNSERIRDIVQLIGCQGREAEASNLERFQAFLDNRHHPHMVIRTMNYPLFLVWSYLVERGPATREELSGIRGLDTTKLPMGNIIRQLERLGRAEEREGRVTVLKQNEQG